MQHLFRQLACRSQYLFTRYKVPYNINQQQHINYIKKVKRSQKILQSQSPETLSPNSKQLLQAESQNLSQISSSSRFPPMPTPFRKISKTKRIPKELNPRLNPDLTNYAAWRVFEQQQLIYKKTEHDMQIYSIMLQPKWVLHTFGQGSMPVSSSRPRSSHKQFYFQDNALNTYLLYQYRNTTFFKQNIQGYNYQNQQHIRPRARITKRITPQQFWKSQEQFQFRFNFTIYAQKYKFAHWLKKEIQQAKEGKHWKIGAKSYDQYIDQKYGVAFGFNQKEERERFQVNKPMVLNVGPDSFGKEKKEVKEKEIKEGKEGKKGKKQKAEKAEKPQKEQKAQKQQKEKSQKAVKQQKDQKQQKTAKTQQPAQNKNKNQKQKQTQKPNQSQKQPSQQPQKSSQTQKSPPKQKQNKPSQPQKQLPKKPRVGVGKQMDQSYRIKQKIINQQIVNNTNSNADTGKNQKKQSV